MKRIIYISLVFLLINYFASAQTPDSLNFFPVHAGDVRQYRSQFTGDLIYTIYTDSVVNITKTKDIMVYDRYVSGMSSYRINRIDTLGNLYILGSQAEYVHYKLYADSGDSWQTGVFNDSAVIATVVYDYTATIFGKYTTVKAIRFTVQESPPPQQPFSFGTDHLAGEFGLIKSEVEPSDVYFLSGAIIDGVRYGVITEVKKEIEVPHTITLFQNYPNPFNPITTIRYDLQKHEYISLKVFDLLGRNVATLFEGYQKYGKHEVQFTASNLSSGVYFYQLKTKEYVMRKRMLVLK